MSPLMTRLEAAPDDPLLSLMVAARADQRPGKVDLSVGVFKDKTGATPIMAAVREAEAHMLRAQTTKVYESPLGNPVYNEAVETLALGGRSDKRFALATPGGSGALFIAMRTARLLSAGGQVWLSDPTWLNHGAIARSVGFTCGSYRYRATAEGVADIDLVEGDLAKAKPGDIVLLQGTCHNPTGTDFNAEAWARLARIVVERQLLPLVDVAYQGFGEGLQPDMEPIRAFLREVPEALVTYSCSKNFGLYRERIGALIVQASDAATADVMKGQVSATVRSCYSMPPAHGAAIVATILSDDTLKNQWLDELNAMRDRLVRLRTGFADALGAASGRNDLQTLARGRGMFCLLPISRGSVDGLREEHGIYMPGSGRINLAGLDEDKLSDVAQKLAPFLNDAE